jgi:ferredoxin
MQMSLYEFKTHVSQLPKKDQAQILDQARVIVARSKIDHCEGCGQIPLTTWRGSRRYCNNACKQKAWRSRRKHHETTNKD